MWYLIYSSRNQHVIFQIESWNLYSNNSLKPNLSKKIFSLWENNQSSHKSSTISFNLEQQKKSLKAFYDTSIPDIICQKNVTSSLKFPRCGTLVFSRNFNDKLSLLIVKLLSIRETLYVILGNKYKSKSY